MFAIARATATRAAAASVAAPQAAACGQRPRTDIYDKTKLCKFYGRGCCDKGDACTYAHGRADLKPQPNFYKTQLCIDFFRQGVCPLGVACRFAHSTQEVRRMDRPPARPLDLVNLVTAMASAGPEAPRPLAAPGAPAPAASASSAAPPSPPPVAWQSGDKTTAAAAEAELDTERQVAALQTAQIAEMKRQLAALQETVDRMLTPPPTPPETEAHDSGDDHEQQQQEKEGEHNGEEGDLPVCSYDGMSRQSTEEASSVFPAQGWSRQGTAGLEPVWCEDPAELMPESLGKTEVEEEEDPDDVTLDCALLVKNTFLSLVPVDQSARSRSHSAPAQSHRRA